MNIPDRELASARNISVEQARLLRESRGATTDNLAGLSESGLRRAIRRLDYQDLPRERALFRHEQEVDDDGQVAPEALSSAVAERAQMVATTLDAASAGVPVGSETAVDGPAAGLATAAWEWIGPGNIGGRTRGIAIDPRDASRMWAASAGGGLWHTNDGGTTWAPVNDFLVNLACTCIVMDPTQPDQMYVGTGEGFNNADALRGAGIFHTTDAITWTQVPATTSPDFYFVNRIAVSPDGQVVLAATGTGIFRSADAARAIWTKVHGVAVGDVHFDPGEGSRAVAGALDAAEAWFSTDGGTTWTPASHGPWSGRVELTYAVADPEVVYASVQAAHGDIWRSADGGQTYQRRSTVDPDGDPAPYLGDQGWYDNLVWAGDPTDPNLVVVGGVNLWRSSDGGDHLSEISTWWAAPESAHADNHAVVAHPAFDGVTNRTIFVGNDGGVYRADDVAQVGSEPSPPYVIGWTELVNSYGATQFYGAAGNSVSGRIIGGAQDNGTVCYDPALGTENWTTIFGGDGGWCAADPTDPMVFYGEYVFLNIHRNTDGGTTDDTTGDRYISGQFWNDAAGTWDWKPVPYQIPDALSRQALFIAPFLLDPNDSNRLLAGGLQLWRTEEAKRPNTPTSGPEWRSIKQSAGSPISAIAVAPTDSDIVWVGHRNGMVFQTVTGTTAAPVWQRIGATGPTALAPQRYCTCITVNPSDPHTVYVAFGGYQSDNVWITRNAGADWAPPSSALPSAPVRAVAIHPRRPELVYLGTEVGVFASEDAGGQWAPTNEGPANVSVDDLFWMGETLVAATHGRGMFRIDLSGV